MNQSKQLFFIALLAPTEVNLEVNNIKQHFAEVYHSKAALKSPPHVTLQPPFYWQTERLSDLKTLLQKFSQERSQIPMILDGFAAFRPRVIYVDVHRTTELLAIHQELMKELESTLGIVHRASKTRPFAPHMTVGFKDLTKINFYKAWQEFKERQLYFEFVVSELTLLAHNGRRWEIEQNFGFNQNSV